MSWSQAGFRSQDSSAQGRSCRRATFLAIYKRSESALPILGTLAGFIRLLDGVVGLRQHDLWKSIGPLVIAALQFAAMYLFGRSARGRAE
jgi:hypothetical protein